MPESTTAGLHGNWVFSFMRNYQTIIFARVAVTFFTSTSDLWVISFFCILSIFDIATIFYFSHSDRYDWWFLSAWFCIIDFLYFFPVFDFTNICSYFHSFICSAWFGFTLPFFSSFLEVGIYIDLGPFFFSNVSIYCYKFSFQHCFSCISYISIYFVFIFIQFYVYFKFFFSEMSYFTWGLFRNG